MTDAKNPAFPIPALPLDRHASDAAVKAILEARKTVQVETPAIPAALKTVPVNQAAIAPSAVVTAHDLTTAPAKGQLVTPPANIPDADVTNFLNTAIQQVTSIAQELFKPPFSAIHALSLAPKLMEAVSFIVATGLPLAKGMEAKALVVVLFRWVFQQYVAPRLGAFSGIVESVALKMLEGLYQAKVQPAAKAFMDSGSTNPTEYAQLHLLNQ